MSVFDVSAVVTGIAELYEPVAEEKGFRLSVAAPPGLTMLGNRELVGQATANLIDNALKYGASNLGSAGSNQITVASRREGGNIVIEIADHGPGVMEADRQRVFDRFVRLEGARSRPGSGLGLSLAAAAARMHGGFVRLEDNMPGLKVVVTLPAAEAAPAAANAPPLERAARDRLVTAPRCGSIVRRGAASRLCCKTRTSRAALKFPTQNRSRSAARTRRSLALPWSLISEDPARAARLLNQSPEFALDRLIGEIASEISRTKPN